MYEITEDEMTGVKAIIGEIPVKYSLQLANFFNSKEPVPEEVAEETKEE